MSSSIDERIVKMQFDNQQFDSGIQSSLKSLDGLKQGLKMEGATKGLSDVERAAKSFSLAGIASGVDTIASKFSTMGIIGVTALANITNSAINTGKSMLSALTLDPIMKGFDEYETKMGSIQTILTNTASKGTTINDVNKALDELNTYSDKTIYNFEEMTRNIGTFTAAGVDLNTSVTSIKGIANLAAGSGSSALQASTAMYQLSQAIASGSVKLQDWNSVVNAGMGGELFQKALEKTASGLGKGRNMAVSFRDSLQDGWITTEVLTKTLQQFAEDPSLLKAATQVKTFTQLFDTMKESVQSGWAKTWETIIGNKDESSAMLTSINDVFGAMVTKSSDARNAMLDFWKANGGRDAMIQAVVNSFNALMAILKPVGEAFRDVFPAMTGQRLVEITKGIRDFTAGLKIGDYASNGLKNTFQGLFAILDIVKQAVVAAGKAFFDLVGYILPAGSGLLSFTGSIGIFLKNLDDTIKKTGIFNSVFSNLSGVIKVAADGIGVAVSGMVKWVAGVGSISVDGISHFVEQVSTRFSPLKSLGGFLGEMVSGIGNALSKLSPIFAGLGNIVGTTLDKMRDSIAKAINGGGGTSLMDMLNTGLFAGILLGIKKFIDTLGNITKDAGGALKGVTGILDGVKGSLSAYQSQLKAGTLLKIAAAIAILAVSLLLLSTIDSGKLTSSLAAITVMFVELFASMAAFQTLSGGGLLSMGKLSVGMIGLSAAVLILSDAMTKIAQLNWEEIAKGLVGIGGIMAELALFMKVSNFSTMGVSTGLGIIALAAGVTILAEAVKTFGGLDTGAMIQGLLGVGAVLAEIAIFVNATGNATGVIATAAGVVLLGAAMLIFAQAISMMGNLSWEVIGKGLLTMASSLVIVSAAIALLPTTGLVAAGIGLIAIATALVILSTALTSMGGMSWEAIGASLVVLAASLTIIATAMIFMQTALPGAAALLVVAGALAVLAPVLMLLGSMSLSDIGTALLVLAGSLTVLGVAGLLLTPIIPSMLGLGAAIVLFGVGCLAAGVGILAFSAGLTALAVSGAAGAAALVLVITSVVNLIPSIAISLANGLTQFIKVIGNNIPTIATAMANMLKGIIDAIIKVVPEIVTSLLGLLVKMLEVFASFIPQLIKAGGDIIVAFLQGVTTQIPRIIQAALDLIIAFINGLADGLRNNTDKMVAAITNLMTAIVEAGAKFLLGSVTKFLDAGQKIMDSGLIKGITDKIGNYASAFGNIIESGVTSLINSVSSFLNAGSQIMDSGLIQGIASKVGSFVSGLGSCISSGVSKAGEYVSQFYTVGCNIVSGIIKGIESKIASLAQSAANLAKQALDAAKAALDSHSPSRVFRDEVGAMIAAGMALGIKMHAKEAAEASSEMSKDVVDAAKEWIDERKYYNQISLEEEYYIWQQIQDKYADGTEERIKADKEAYTIKKEMRKEEFDNWIKDIENKKYYNQLSTKDEAGQYAIMTMIYEKGSEEQIQAAKELYRLKNELYKEDYDNAVKAIDDAKYYNQLSLVQELEAWQKIQAKYADGTDERTKADREVYRVQKELTEKRQSIENNYYSKTKAVNDKLQADIKSLNDEYDNALKSRTDSLYKAYGLFDRIQVKKPVSGARLTANLEGQIKDFDVWQQNLNDLSNKGIGEDLVKELRDMGEQSGNEIKTLNNMTKPKLDKYVSLWKLKHNQVKVQSLSELDDLKNQTTIKIEELKNQANIDLTALRNDWASQMSQLTYTSQYQLTVLNKTFSTKIDTLTKTTVQQFTSLSETIQNIDWVGVGNSIVNGMIVGIQQRAYILAIVAAQTAMSALQAAKDALGIHSPSKEFAKLGMYAVEGLAMGLTKYSGMVDNAAGNVGITAIDSLKSSLSKLSDIVYENVDCSPVIRPVLDMTDIKDGCKTINGLISQKMCINTSLIAKRAKNINIPKSNMSDNIVDIIKGKLDNIKIEGNGITQNVEIYSPKALSPYETARQNKMALQEFALQL